MRGCPACGFTVPTCRKPVKFDTISSVKYNVPNGPDGLAPITKGFVMVASARRFICAVDMDFTISLAVGDNGLWGSNNSPSIVRREDISLAESLFLGNDWQYVTIEFDRPVSLARLVCVFGPRGMRTAYVENEYNDVSACAMYLRDMSVVQVSDDSPEGYTFVPAYTFSELLAICASWDELYHDISDLDGVRYAAR